MRIVIVGAGGHGRVVLDIIRNNHQFDIAGMLDSNTARQHDKVDGVEILGDLSLISQFGELGIGAAVVAIGDNNIRAAYAQALQKAGVSLVSAIHPSCSIADTARIGKNVVIASGVNVCTHVTVADSAILNTGCIVEHESHIGPAAHICPGVKLAGHVTVQGSAFVGIGATVIQGVTIGEAAVVGAGAVVLNDVPAYATVVGVPARLIKSSHLAQDGGREGVSTADLEPARSLVTRPKRRRPVELTAVLQG